MEGSYGYIEEINNSLDKVDMDGLNNLKEQYDEIKEILQGNIDQINPLIGQHEADFQSVDELGSVVKSEYESKNELENEL